MKIKIQLRKTTVHSRRTLAREIFPFALKLVQIFHFHAPRLVIFIVLTFSISIEEQKKFLLREEKENLASVSYWLQMVNITNRILYNDNGRIARDTSKPIELWPVDNTTNEKAMSKILSKGSEDFVIHGRNTFAFWTVFSLLFVFAIGNLILTLTIFGVLGLGKGISFLEVSLVAIDLLLAE